MNTFHVVHLIQSNCFGKQIQLLFSLFSACTWQIIDSLSGNICSQESAFDMVKYKLSDIKIEKHADSAVLKCEKKVSGTCLKHER